MARPYWSGSITISFVTFAVKLFTAVETKSEIHFHQIARSTGQRVRHQKVAAPAPPADDPEAAAEPAVPVEQDEILKGYEYRKGKYVTFEPGELDALRMPSKTVMDVVQCVHASEIDPSFYEKPYFVMPADDSQAPAYALIRKALEETGQVALSRIAFAGREHVVAIAPAEDGGLMAYTMRYAAELRDAHDLFRMIKRTTVEKDSLELARKLVESKSAPFAPEKFVDGYETALKELVQSKVDKEPLPEPEEDTRFAQGEPQISLLDALRKSVASVKPGEEELKHKAVAKHAGKTAESGKGKVITLVKGDSKPDEKPAKKRTRTA